MNHSLNYSSYIEKLKNDSNLKEEEVNKSGNMANFNLDDPSTDHFDPVAFYTSTEEDLKSENISEIVSETNPGPRTETSRLRRSIRPKPSVEALISSPPAIKFYKSTVIRSKSNSNSSENKIPKSLAIMKKKKLLVSELVNADKIIASTTTSPILKLRLPMSSNQSHLSDSKENVSDKRNLRVVKLMMPDMTSEELDDPLKEIPIKAKKVKKLREITDSKGNIMQNNGNMNEESSKRKRVKREKAEKTDKNVKFSGSKAAAPSIASSTSISPASVPNYSKLNVKKEEIINEDVCSSCDGLGNFICCDSCPRSFHFTCAEPPLDPLNLPEDDWFCSECRHSQAAEKDQDGTHDHFDRLEEEDDDNDIWKLMIRETKRINPKCFVMPRRFRYQPKEEDLQKLISGEFVTSYKKKDRIDIPQITHIQINQSPPTIKAPIPTGPIIINDTIKLDHCYPPSSFTLKTPNISSIKNSFGYCHCCSLYGLTKQALQRSSEDPSIPCDLRLQRPMLSCNICPLYWHLDCLDPPLPSFPSNSESGWTCPIHFTSEKCLALDLCEALVQATLLLPEEAIKRQFEQKVRRRRESSELETSENTSVIYKDEVDEDEQLYGIDSSFVHVPESIKQLYK